MEQYNEVLLPAPAYLPTPEDNRQSDSTGKPFIEANTAAVSLREIRDDHIIPVYAKDNEPLISHYDFISITMDEVQNHFSDEVILDPAIRVSHPIKGRIPEARNKPAHQLQEWEKTLYYERMAFVIELPEFQDTIDGNQLTLTVGGVKAYNHDNLYLKKGADEHFKMFIGFQNKVCTNLCVWTDGYQQDVRVHSAETLRMFLSGMFKRYRAKMHLEAMKELSKYYIKEQQFAQIMGRARMYQYLPAQVKKDIKPLLFTDTQLGAVTREYYRDESFCRNTNGDINLWRLYNLLTGANKSTYIDQFLDRSVNAYDFTEQLRWTLEGHTDNWYLQ